MDAFTNLCGFLEAAADDPKLTPTHLSLYFAIVYFWKRQGSCNPVSVFRNDLMRFSKIAGRSTYQKCMQDLHEYGYIRYIPSFNHYVGSIVHLTGFPECILRIQREKLT
jgi:hypothetical protein